MVNKLKNEVLGNIRTLKTKGSFIQNLVLSFAGNAMSFVMQLVFTPIIARIYGPESYGTFALFNALITNVVTITTLRYETAFVLPKEKKEFNDLLRLTILLSVAVSVVFFILFIFFNTFFIDFFQIKRIQYAFILIPLMILISCISIIVQNWTTRVKAYREFVASGLPIGLGSRFSTIGYGLLTKGNFWGLILGDFISKIASIIVMIKMVFKSEIKEVFQNFQFKDIKEVALKYKNYPLYILPGDWFNLLSAQLPLYMLTASFGTNPVGQFGFAISLLEIPMRLLGSSISPVFLQKASETYHENPNDLRRIAYQLYTKLLYMGVWPFAFLAVFGDWIFIIAFGKQWETAGLFSTYMGFYYLFRLVASPLSSVFNILRKESLLLYFQIILFIGRFGTLYVGLYYLESLNLGILLFSVFNALLYFLLLIFIFKMINVSVIKTLIISIGMIAGSYFLFYLLRNILNPYFLSFYE